MLPITPEQIDLLADTCVVAHGTEPGAKYLRRMSNFDQETALLKVAQHAIEGVAWQRGKKLRWATSRIIMEKLNQLIGEMEDASVD